MFRHPLISIVFFLGVFGLAVGGCYYGWTQFSGIFGPVEHFFADEIPDFFNNKVGGFFKNDIPNFFNYKVGPFFNETVGGFFKKNVTDFFNNKVGGFFRNGTDKLIRSDFYNKDFPQFFIKDIPEFFNKTGNTAAEFVDKTGDQVIDKIPDMIRGSFGALKSMDNFLRNTIPDFFKGLTKPQLQ